MSTVKLNQSQTQLILVMGLFVLSLLVRLAILLPSQFDGLYGQDAYAYYDYAQMLRSSLQSATPLPPFFWPLGYPVLLVLSQTMGGTQPTVAQSISIVLGAALSPLVYLLARQLGIGRFGSIAAALVMMFCGQALQSSIVIMSDIPALFWATSSALLLSYYLRTFSANNSSNRWLVLAAITLTFAVVTRWLYVLLGIPFSLAILIAWRGHIHWRAVALALLTASLVYLPQLVFSRTNPAPTLNHEWVESWSLANAFRSSFTNYEGQLNFEKINALYFAQPYYDDYYLAPLLTLFIIIGLWAFYQRGIWQLILVGGWAFLPYLFLAGIPSQNIRYPLIVFPAVAILAASGLESAATRLGRLKYRWISPRLAYLLMVLILVTGLGRMWVRANEVITTFITNQQNDKQAAAWAGETIPAGANVYTFGLTLTLKHYTPLNVYEIYYETPDTLAQKWQRGRVDYLLLNVWNIENQWAGLIPQIDYYWLRDERGLERIGKYGNYTLYKIRG